METRPLIVIVGPTASGKTALAIDLAKRFGGEIICADSRTVYKGLDVGTAKPTLLEQKGVSHWGLDLVEPNDRFTAADFQRYAVEKIEQIRARGNIPFLVGGTGLYIDAVIFSYEFGQDRSIDRRQQLEALSFEELINYCLEHNVKLPENSSNKRYVIRAIEQNTINNRRSKEPIGNSIIVGIATNRDILRTRIKHRSEHIFANGVVEEARKLGEMYGWDNEAMTGNIYRIIRDHLGGGMSLIDAQHVSMTRDWRLAKRQLTWFRRNSYIRWLSLNDANSFLIRQLENHLDS